MKNQKVSNIDEVEKELLIEKIAQKPISDPRNFISTIKLIISYLVEDMKRGPLQFKIAVFTIFIIVAFMSILLNANSVTTTMFLGIAERQAGDTDFIITKQSQGLPENVGNGTLNILNSLPLLNIKEVSDKVKLIPEFDGATERWLLPGRLRNGDNLTISTASFAVIGNSLKEKSLGLGRALNVGPLIENECLIVQRTANMIKLEGDKVQFKLSVVDFLTDSNLEVDGLQQLTDLALQAIPD